MVPMHVKGVVLVPPETAPVMLLRETTGDQRWLAIAIGAPEAEALLAAQQQVEHPRPGTVELIGRVLEAFGRQLVRVEVTDLRDGVFLSDLVLDGDLRITARPSDAVAIGLRAGVPVEVAETVLDTAAVDIELADAVDPSDPASSTTTGDQERQIEDFRALLDQTDPEDFRDN
ncbi:bifunctional nuclease family protein [Amycolatopsis cihanbeyliensis]|nr:bifunctional nuclease family protein [Amycolatopsis cihanbeyliensis]